MPVVNSFNQIPAGKAKIRGGGRWAGGVCDLSDQGQQCTDDAESGPLLPTPGTVWVEICRIFSTPDAAFCCMHPMSAEDDSTDVDTRCKTAQAGRQDTRSYTVLRIVHVKGHHGEKDAWWCRIVIMAVGWMTDRAARNMNLEVDERCRVASARSCLSASREMHCMGDPETVPNDS